MGVACLIHQPVYNMFNRWVEDGLLDALDEEGIGCIAFSPLAQGLLTNRYLEGIPEGSRATKVLSYLPPERIKAEQIAKVRKLNEIAKARGQSMAEMALVWVLRRKTVTSALIGASSPQQLEDNVAALKNMDFSDGELQAIEQILKI
jgi:L-glyceraldehyde 3-phosphate reductase